MSMHWMSRCTCTGPSSAAPGQSQTVDETEARLPVATLGKFVSAILALSGTADKDCDYGSGIRSGRYRVPVNWAMVV